MITTLNRALVTFSIALLATACASAPRADSNSVRQQLDRWYTENAAAYRASDLPRVMSLRAADFHSITPDGRVNDRAAMENYTQGIMNGVKEWKNMVFTIDSLATRGDTAIAVVSQYLDRMALRPDNQVHHVQTWVTQRETFIRSGRRWLLWRVDQLRNQRRLVDGQPQ
jgi:ketosteroid isomerase-like protein